MLSIHPHATASDLPEAQDQYTHPAHDVDDFEPPEGDGPEEEPDEPVSGDGAEGYPLPGSGLDSNRS